MSSVDRLSIVPEKALFHFRQSFDRGLNEFQHANPLRLLGPAGEGGILEVARQPDAAGHDNPIVRPFASRALGRGDEEAVQVHEDQGVAALAARAVVCLISSRSIAASSKSSCLDGFGEFLLEQLEPVGQIAALAQGFGHFAHVPRAFVHRLEQTRPGLGKGLVTLRAAQPAGLLEIRLGEPATRDTSARVPPPACSISCEAPSPSSRSARENPVGSLTPLVLAHSSHRSTFCILSPAIWVRCTVASFSLQMQHNIISLLVYRLAGHFSQGAVLRHQVLASTGPGLPAPMTRPSIFTTGTFGPGAGQETLVGVEQS